MSKLNKESKKILLMGWVCLILLIAAVSYSLLFNEGRWVKEMDLSEYVFSPKDLPMLAAGILIAAYAVYVLAICLKKACFKKIQDQNYTRTLSPLWGFCGFFGFLGFGGFWTYREYGQIFPFLFFIFFGLFGLFFEGKLSHTLEDELFLENKRKAQLNAYKTGFALLFLGYG